MSDNQSDWDVYRKHLRGSFPYFLTEVWHFASLPKPSNVQLWIAYWLANGPRRRGIRGFRGVSKTWLTLSYALWRLNKDINQRVTIISKSEGHAKNSLHLMRQWIREIPFLQYLNPRKRRDAATKFDVEGSLADRTPSVAAFGIEGQITGERGTIVIGDDVETKVNTQTVEMREQLRTTVTEFDNILIPGGDIIFLGSPHAEQSLYNDLANSGFAFRDYPARYPDKEQQKVIPYLAPEYHDRMTRGLSNPGDATWPQRFTDQELMERHASIGQYEWDMQYMLMSVNPKDLKYRIRQEDFMVLDVDFSRRKAPAEVIWGKTDHNGSTAIEDLPTVGLAGDRFYRPVFISKTWAQFQTTKMTIDPSGGVDDTTAWTIIGGMSGLLFAKEVNGYKGTHTTENLDLIVASAKRNLVDDIIIESNFGGEIMAQLLGTRLTKAFVKPGESSEYPDGWACSVSTKHSTGLKEGRILDSISGPAKSHRIVVSRQVAENIDLWNQMTKMVRQRRCLNSDDEMDSFASCVDEFKTDLDQDAQAAAEGREQEEIEAEMEKYEEWLEEVMS